MSRPDSVMVFAAGFGTRMGALAADRPKPLVPVGGRALLDHALAAARAIGPRRIAVNTHHRAEMIARHLADHPEVAISHEAEAIRDTGGGLAGALPLLGGDGPVFTLTSDAVWTGPDPLSTLAAAWAPERMDGLLLLVELDRARGRSEPGDFDRDAAGRLSRGGPYVFTGAQIVKTDRLAAVTERVFSIDRLWRAMAAEGRLHGVMHPGGWADAGHPEGVAAAETLLAEAAHVPG